MSIRSAIKSAQGYYRTWYNISMGEERWATEDALAFSNLCSTDIHFVLRVRCYFPPVEYFCSILHSIRV